MLKTDYKDQLLEREANTNRKYTVINNSDGTISLIDSTTYSQSGDNFGASDINATNTAVNACLQIVSFDASTGTLVTKSADYTG